MTASALALLVWLSPSFPVGAFAYSHGLEWAHESGDLHDAASLEAWLADLLRHGAGHSDAVLLALAHDAAGAGDEARLGELAELGMALSPSAERRLETATQGNAFAGAVAASWPCESMARLRALVPGDIPYPVAVGVAASGHGIDRDATLDAFCLGFIANLVSASVRLGIVGQTDAQRVIAALVPLVRETARNAASCGLDDLGGCAFRSDLGSLRHETQYSRLFRS